MRSFFNWAEIELHLLNRPDKRIRRPKYKKALIQPFTKEDIVSLLKACEYTSTAKTEKRKAFTMRRKTAPRDSAIVWVLLDTALRVSELCRLNYCFSSRPYQAIVVVKEKTWQGGPSLFQTLSGILLKSSIEKVRKNE